jgi:hypothetical protein
MTRPRRENIEYPKKEAQQRFEAALRGARIAGPQHKVSAVPERKTAKRKKAK